MGDREHGTFRDSGLPLADRLADLLGRLTLAEKTGLLHQHQAPVPRLGLGPFRTGTEALHGVAWLGRATVFPQAVGLGASWEPDLVRRVGAAVGDEVRGMHHKEPDRVGLNVWAPVVNPLRDPRWGRGEEGYSEDPWLTGLIATAFASGLRGDHPRYLRTAPTLKHFLAYNNETRRHLTSSSLPPRVLHEYELPAFRAPIETGAAVAVMASYNFVNGRPAHLSPLIAEQLRTWSADDVLVVGDAGAGTNIAGGQRYLPDHAAGFGAALRAGIDCFTEDDADSAPTVARITEALNRGLITELDVEAAARHVLAVRFRLGEFDPAEDNPYAAITPEVINSSAHQALARQAARSAVVLLKNSAGLLPLAGDQRLAIIGPLADVVLTDWYSGTLPYAVSPRAGLTDRLSPPDVSFTEGSDRVTLRTPAGVVRAVAGPDGGAMRIGDPIDGDHYFDVLDWGRGLTLRAVANRRYVRADEDQVLLNDSPGPGQWIVRETFEAVPHEGGVALRHVASDRYVKVGYDGVLRAQAAEVAEAEVFTVDLVEDGQELAAAAARTADLAVVVVGNHPMVAGRETEDRTDLDLPPAQESLVRAVHAANPRTVLVIASSYPYALGEAGEQVPAILWSCHGGQEFGSALADVLLGSTVDGTPVDPTGRLPQTWYRDARELPDLLDYDIIGSDATYQYFAGEALYPFGHGLSYTRFEHRNVRLSATEMGAGEQTEVSIDVTNVGERPGTEVVQLYTRQQSSRVKQPLRRLRAAGRVRLEPGEQRTVTFTLAADDLAFYDVTRQRAVVETARHSVLVGRSCTDITAVTTLTVHGEDIPPRAANGCVLNGTAFDEEYGIQLTGEYLTHGDAVTATRSGAWLCLRDVDFGTGVGRVAVRTSAPAGGATIEVRLDDPFSGPPAALLHLPATPDRYTWTEVSGPVSAASGIRDLYVVFDRAEARLSTIAFEGPVD